MGIIFFILIFGLFIYLLISVISFSISKRDVAQYLRSKNMKEDLDDLEIGTGNIRGLNYAKKFKKFYCSTTNDFELNELKKIVWKKNKKNQKIMILWVILVVVVMILSIIMILVAS